MEGNGDSTRDGVCAFLCVCVCAPECVFAKVEVRVLIPSRPGASHWREANVQNNNACDGTTPKRPRSS